MYIAFTSLIRYDTIPLLVAFRQKYTCLWVMLFMWRDGWHPITFCLCRLSSTISVYLVVFLGVICYDLRLRMPTQFTLIDWLIDTLGCFFYLLSWVLSICLCSFNFALNEDMRTPVTEWCCHDRKTLCASTWWVAPVVHICMLYVFFLYIAPIEAYKEVLILGYIVDL